MSDDEPMPDTFEEWLNMVGSFIEPLLKARGGKNLEALNKIYVWKTFERKYHADFFELIYTLYPDAGQAPLELQPYLKQNLVQAILTLTYAVWDTAAGSESGKHPSEAMPKIWDAVLRDEAMPALRLVTWEDGNLDSVPQEYLAAYKKSWGEYMEEENPRRTQDRKEEKEKAKAIIDFFQERLIPILPQIMDMEGDWWRVYRYYMHTTAYLLDFEYRNDEFQWAENWRNVDLANGKVMQSWIYPNWA